MSNITLIEAPVTAPIKMGNTFDSGGASVREGLIVAKGTNLGGGTTYVAIYQGGICAATWSERHGGYYSTAALPCPGYKDAALRNYEINWDDYADLAADLQIFGTNLTDNRVILDLMEKYQTVACGA